MKQDKIEEKLNNISIQIATMETHMNDKFGEITDHLKKLNGSVARHEKSIYNLELWQSNWKGKITVITLIIAAIISVASYLIEKSIGHFV